MVKERDGEKERERENLRMMEDIYRLLGRLRQENCFIQVAVRLEKNGGGMGESREEKQEEEVWEDEEEK